MYTVFMTTTFMAIITYNMLSYIRYSIQQRMDEAVIRRQKEASAALRLKSLNSNISSSNTEQQNAINSQSSYLQQKSALEAQSGSKGEESGKWLVR